MTLQETPSNRKIAEDYAANARSAGAAADRQAYAHIAQAYATLSLGDQVAELALVLLRLAGTGLELPNVRLAAGAASTPKLPGDIGAPGAPIAEASREAIAAAAQLASARPGL